MSLLTNAYALANRSGLLRIPGVYAAFTRLYWVYKARLEDPFAALLQKHPELFRGGHIVDVGANIGYTSSVFLQAVEEPYRVFALEPEQRNFETLLALSKSERGAWHFVPLHLAAGETAGYLDLWKNDAHHADHRIATAELKERLGAAAPIERVEVVSIDALLAQRNAATPVAFIKIDVQGFELAVCRGLERTLSDNAGLSIALEYAPAGMRELGFAPEDVLRFFEERNIPIQVIGRDGNLWEFASPQAQQALAKRGYVDLLCSRLTSEREARA